VSYPGYPARDLGRFTIRLGATTRFPRPEQGFTQIAAGIVPAGSDGARRAASWQLVARLVFISATVTPPSPGKKFLRRAAKLGSTMPPKRRVDEFNGGHHGRRRVGTGFAAFNKERFLHMCFNMQRVDLIVN
jgi:hypothetical protein